jgi:hypothetical protein
VAQLVHREAEVLGLLDVELGPSRGSARRRADADPLRLNKLTERLVLALADTMSLDESADQVAFVVTKRRVRRG